jgi:hypothetical protein
LITNAHPIEKVDKREFLVNQTGDKNSSIILSSPPDIKILPNDTLARIAWDVLFYNAFGDSWVLLLNGDPIEQNVLMNGSTVSFNLSDYFLPPGSHNFTFIATAFSFDNTTIAEKDSIWVHAIISQTLPQGTTTIHLEGTPQAKVIPTVNQSVGFTVTPSSTPLAGSDQALSDFQIANPNIILTNYYLEINYTVNAVTELWLNISYLDWELIDRLGLDPPSLKIYAFDTMSSTWRTAGTTGVDLENYVVFAHINPPNTSYTVGGSAPTLTGGTGAPPTQTTSATTPGFNTLITLIIIAVGIGVRGRKKK